MSDSFDGGCDCKYVRYRMKSRPLFVNCCHCRWCQRETGSAFVINAMIEADRVEMLANEPEVVDTPSSSGKGQLIARCPKCRVALWSNYGGFVHVRFVRVGTLDNPDEFRRIRQKPDTVRFNHCVDDERAAGFALAPAAMAAVHEQGRAQHAIAHGPAVAAAGEVFGGHGNSFECTGAASRAGALLQEQISSPRRNGDKSD